MLCCAVLCKLQVEGLQELQDLMNCIILSEHVYKVRGVAEGSRVGEGSSVGLHMPLDRGKD